MAIVNKNFRVKNGLIVDGSVATVNGYNVLTEASTAFIISTVGGSADTANTPNTVVKRDGSGNFAAGTITASIVGNLTGNVTGTVSSLSNHDTADLAEGSNLYFTNARALAATAAAYDAAGAASSAQANAATDATSKVAAEATARNTAISSAIATEVTDRNSAIATAKSAAEATAAADATSKVAAEAALRVSGDAASVSTAAADATSKVAAEATARNSAISTAISGEVTDRNSAIATAQSAAQAAAESTADSALTNVKNGTTPFTKVNVNDVAAVRAATSTVASASTVNALTWAAADYRTAKALVKLKNGVNTQVSEILLTLDTSNNVAITEFGTITTGADLGTVTAAYVSGDVSVSVTTTYASTDVMVYATLIK